MHAAPPAEPRYTVLFEGRRYHLTRSDLANEVRLGRIDVLTPTWRAEGGEAVTVGDVIAGTAPPPPQPPPPPADGGALPGTTLATVLGVLPYPLGLLFVVAALAALAEGSFALGMGLILVGIACGVVMSGVSAGLKLLHAAAAR
jgi:hypothetical protein